MPRQSLDETIIAVSTAPGRGGIGIVRLSGPAALPIALQIFNPRRARTHFPPLRTILGDLVGEAGKKFDEAFLTYFKAPHSYTREDIVELSCHGSPAVLAEAVRLGVRAGARRAHPGEFTQRAFLRGRIDILQAEAVQSLVDSDSLLAARISYGQLRRGLSSRLDAFRDKILTLLADIEAKLEFPDEDARLPEANSTENSLKNALHFIDDLVRSHESGRLMTEGFRVAIVGRPNVGKSTLFNALSGKNRAIVTPYPGTTRDYLEEKMRIGEAVFNLIDMAGMGTASHPVEKEGIRIGRELAREADGVLFVVDSSRKGDRTDLELIRGHQGPKRIVVFNKSDLPAKMDKTRILAAAVGSPHVELSALRGKNVDTLLRIMKAHFSPPKKKWDEIILHSRQQTILEQIRDRLEAGLRLAREGSGDELCAEEVRKVIPLLGRMTGEIQTEEILRRIFDRFCIGK